MIVAVWGVVLSLRVYSADNTYFFFQPHRPTGRLSKTFGHSWLAFRRAAKFWLTLPTGLFS